MPQVFDHDSLSSYQVANLSINFIAFLFLNMCVSPGGQDQEEKRLDFNPVSVLVRSKQALKTVNCFFRKDSSWLSYSVSVNTQSFQSRTKFCIPPSKKNLLLARILWVFLASKSFSMSLSFDLMISENPELQFRPISQSLWMGNAEPRSLLPGYFLLRLVMMVRPRPSKAPTAGLDGQLLPMLLR